MNLDRVLVQLSFIGVVPATSDMATHEPLPVRGLQQYGPWSQH